MNHLKVFYKVTGKKFTIGAFSAAWIRVKEVTLLQWIRNHPESAFPSAVEEMKGTFNPLPVRQVEESVGDRL